MGRRRFFTRRPERPKSKKQPMLNVRREEEFKYDLKRVLQNGGMDEKVIPSFIATLFSKGSRINLYEAQDYVKEKFDEGLFDDVVLDKIQYLLNRYKRWR